MRNIVLVVIAAITLIVAVTIPSNAYKNRHRTNDVIDVTGLGKKDFVADLIVWEGSFGRKKMNLQDAYTALKADQETIKAYLTGKGIAAEELVFTAVDINKDFDYYYNDNGDRISTFTGYRLTQRVEIESKAVDKVEAISREVTELINQGVEFNSFAPQYYYTQLAELKIQMIAEATTDATTRGEQIAENANAKLGDLRYARMGVFQIIAQNSNEDYSWGGTYNTSSKRKTATITMKLQFGVN